MTQKINSNAALIDDLFEYSRTIKVCPHIARDKTSPYCTKDLSSNSKISEQRRMVCEIYSLQLYCLNSRNYKNCIFYLGVPVE